MKRLLLSALLLIPTAAFAAPAGLTVTPGDKGMTLDAGTVGQFTFRFPTLSDAAGKEAHKVVQTARHDRTITISYDGGATLDMAAGDDGEVRFQFANMPADVTQWRVDTIIPLTYSQGGKWKLGSHEGAVPAEGGVNAHLIQDHASDFELVDAQGVKLDFAVPQNSYLELSDNRFWHWPVFSCAIHLPYNATHTSGAIKVSLDASNASTGPQVDSFGQTKNGDWPGKIHSADELQADVKSEAAYYENLHPPVGDPFGGLPGSREKLSLQMTGFFHVEQKAGRWYLVDPAGNAFFHLGICAVHCTEDWTTVAGRESIFEWLPPHDGEFQSAYLAGNPGVLSFHLTNMIRKYGEPYSEDGFAARMIPRFRKWGFNSVGAFSPTPPSVETLGVPHVRSLPLSQYGEFALPDLPGVHGGWDPYDEKNRQRVEAAFARELPPHATDPLLIGYFLTNEPIYEDLPRVIPSLDGGKFACKRALVAYLRTKYPTIEAFDRAWESAAKSFDELGSAPLVARTRAASEDVHAFVTEFFEPYFKLVADTFHKYDGHHMLLGNRLQPGTINNEALCRTAGKYLDVMSFNYYTNALDPDFLGRVQQWAGRPMMMSEFSFSSPSDSGLLGGSEISSQHERGLAYRQYVEQAAATGYVVGIEWFTLVDQACTGRWFEKFNGERANTGFINVADRPYKEMLEEVMAANYHIYSIELGEQKPFVWDDPRFTANSGAKRIAAAPRAKGPIKLDGNANNWPGIPPNLVSGSHLTAGREASGFEGSFRVCWDDTDLYVLVNVKDPTPLQNKNPLARLWSADGIELFLGAEKPAEGGPLKYQDQQLLIGAAAAGAAPYYFTKGVEQYPCDAQVFAGQDGYTIEAAIPWRALGTNPHEGQDVLFDLAIDDSTNGIDRRAQIMWSGGAKNSSDRTHWGTIHLSP